MTYFNQHKPLLEKAVKALHNRTFFAQYPEHPTPKIYGEDADEQGRKAFQSRLNKKFEELRQASPEGWLGNEESPYLQDKLGIEYPKFRTETLIKNARTAFHDWRSIPAGDRAGLLIESLERIKERFFEIAYATMHTTGQGYMMAFQASGPHAADRALEAIAAGYDELSSYPEKTIWDKPMGKYNVTLEKEYKAVPKGIGVVIGCSTFPTWNSVPGIFANLITGNAAIVKPHPGAILPIAIYVAEIQKVISEAGHDPHIIQLAVDTQQDQVTNELVSHEYVSLIDFTGNGEYGAYLESIKDKVVFTEKTGVNSVIMDSVSELEPVLQNLAFSISLYSGQMCTAPQNFFIPEDGIKTAAGMVSFDEFVQKFKEQVVALRDNPKAAPHVYGSIQNKATLERIKDAEKLGTVLLESTKIENPIFKNARTASPLLLTINGFDEEIFGKELFGPISLLIKTKNTDHSIALAQEMAQNKGALSCAAYTTDPEVKAQIADAMSLAATPVSFNFVGNFYLNQHAAFSDFHVTGGNPAGNASFTNSEFINRRFTWVGFREPVSG